MVDIILQFCATQLEFVYLLIAREIDLLFYTIHGVVKPMILVEHFPEMVIRAFQPSDDVSMFRKLSEDWMMKVHGYSLPFKRSLLFVELRTGLETGREGFES